VYICFKRQNIPAKINVFRSTLHYVRRKFSLILQRFVIGGKQVKS